MVTYGQEGREFFAGVGRKTIVCVINGRSRKRGNNTKSSPRKSSSGVVGVRVKVVTWNFLIDDEERGESFKRVFREDRHPSPGWKQRDHQGRGNEGKGAFDRLLLRRRKPCVIGIFGNR